ncbi:MAG: serine hydrolase [Chloroflexi bacterium]|nr:serine hydrolase [Chloroflexota bacterium]MDA1146872.1 serine hydrolase [Chloroflexota bacterium]
MAVDAAFRQGLRARVEEAMARLAVPGVVVGILEGGRETVECFGATSIEHPLAVDEHTLFQIGSTTKTFTATLLMQDLEAGRLDLDLPIRRYLPELRLQREEWSDTLTTRQLLTHTGGFDGDWFLVHPRPVDDRLASTVSTLADAPCDTPPGAAYAYSNAGFAVLGRLAEVLAGDRLSYEELVAQRIFEPLGLTHSVIRPHDVLLHRFVAGHLVRDGQIEVARPWHLARSAAAHGAIASNVLDQLRWLRFQLGDGTGTDAVGQTSRVLGEATLRSMQTRQVDGGSNCEGIGFAWMRELPGDTEVWRHGGETNGHMCGFKFVPARDFGIVVMTNSSSGIRLHEDLIEWVFDELLDLRPVEPAIVPAPELAPILGRYGGSLRDLVLTQRDGELWVELQIHQRDGRPKPLVTPPTRGEFVSPSTFVTRGPLLGEGNILAQAGTEVGPFVRWDGRMLRRIGDA